MIHGIGVDIVSIERMAANIRRFGDRFAQRVLGQKEFSEYRQSSQRASFLSKRFAAKEATAKALGTGFRDGLYFSQIAVTHDDFGRPLLQCSGRAETLFRQFGIGSAHLSLSDEADNAIAFVLLERRPETSGSEPC